MHTRPQRSLTWPQVEHEIHHMLHHLEEYMAPEKVSTDLLNLPGWSYIYKDPLGVCLILGAWNYPVQLTLLPLVGCIAAGNCVIVKVPSANYSAKTSHTMATLAHKYLDTSCIRFIEGDRVETQQTLSHRYDLIFFTGGQFVGKMVAEAAAKHLTPTVLELGGKSPCIVDKTADLTVAARRIAWATFLNGGQTCLRPDYLLIHRDVAKEFYTILGKVVSDFYTSNPQKSEFFGRVINARAHERLRQLVTSSKQYIVFGGECDESDKYVAPTLFDFGTNVKEFVGSALMADEIFGPLLPSLQFTQLDEVISFISSRDKPLGLYCFTTDDTFRDRILTETSSGVCNINDCMMNMSNENLPFGGVGASGMGSYHGKQSFMTFSHRKSVLMKTNFLDVSLRYPPYGERTVDVMKFILQARPAWHFTALKFSAAIAVCVAVFSRFSLARVPQVSRL